MYIYLQIIPLSYGMSCYRCNLTGETTQIYLKNLKLSMNVQFVVCNSGKHLR